MFGNGFVGNTLFRCSVLQSDAWKVVHGSSPRLPLATGPVWPCFVPHQALVFACSRRPTTVNSLVCIGILFHPLWGGVDGERVGFFRNPRGIFCFPGSSFDGIALRAYEWTLVSWITLFRLNSCFSLIPYFKGKGYHIYLRSTICFPVAIPGHVSA